MIPFLKSRFSPFQYPQYRKYFAVQMISLIGTWSHDLARAWLILDIAEKSIALGGVMLATAIPGLLLLIPGGVFVDRSNPKKMMILTKAILGVSALTLAYLTEFTTITYIQLLLFAVLDGAVGAFDFPALQTVSSRLLPKKELQQVIALNATNFHMSRALGPLVAGLALAWHGPSLVFAIDAVSFFILAITLFWIEIHIESPDKKKGKSIISLEQLLSGFKYIRRDHEILYRISQFFLSVSILFPLSTAVYRAFFRIKFDLNAEVFGYIFSSSSFGAMFGAICLTILKPKNPLIFLKVAIPLVFLLHLMIINATQVGQLYPIMFASGICTFLIFASINMSIQMKVEESYRGRIGAFIGLGWLSVGPLFGFPIGWFADHIGFEISILTLSISFIIGSAFLALLNHLHKPNHSLS